MLESALLLALLAYSPVAQDEAPKVEDELVEREFSVEIDGATVRYKTSTGTLVLRRENGEPRASVFFIAYTRTDVDDLAKRPLTVSFNGGPGSSSVWLHLGAFGPRRVDLGEEGFSARPPYDLVDNASSILDLTDLVFVDPVMTGYSRPAEGEDKKQFHGVREDVESVGEFIRLFLTRNQRWQSPIFLAGESYGTTRAAGLSNHLQSRHGIYPSGIVLVSSILNFLTTDMAPGNDLPFALYLPSFTATAWYHQRLEPALQKNLGTTLAAVEEFALGTYNSALLAGDTLDDETRTRVAGELARYLGVSREFVLENDLRVTLSRFTKELLRDQRRTVGRLDARYKGIDRNAGGERYEYDPSYAAIQGPYSMALNHYVRAELGYESDLPYEILTGRVRPWSYDAFENRYVNVAEDLRKAINVNRDLMVYVANGYYDLATPYFATKYTFTHLGLEPELRGNVTMGDYESGHMMYVHEASLRRLKSDLAAFYSRATSR